MFDRTFRDAHGVGITSGLEHRPHYARGGRIGLQDGTTVRDEFTEQFGNIFGTDADDVIGMAQGVEGYFPESTLPTREEYLKEQAKLRGEYLPAASRQADWLDLAQFFTGLPGPGGLGENILRSGKEVLPQFAERKRAEKDLERAFAVQDIENYAKLQAASEQAELAKKEASLGYATEIWKQLNKPKDIDQQRKTVMEIGTRLRLESPKFKSDMEALFKVPYAEIAEEDLIQQAERLIYSWQPLTPTDFGEQMELYGLGRVFRITNVAQEYIDANKDYDKNQLADDRKPLQYTLDGLRSALRDAKTLFDEGGMTEEQYNKNVTTLFDSFPLWISRNPEEVVMPGNLFNGYRTEDITAMAQASSERLSEADRQALVDQGTGNSFLDYTDIVRAMNDAWVNSNIERGMILILPNGTRVRYLGLNGDENAGLGKDQPGYVDDLSPGEVVFTVVTGGSYSAGMEEGDPAFATDEVLTFG